MADDFAQEKTEPATPRRKEEARKEGKVARSQETSSLAVLLFGAIALFFLMPGMLENLAGFTSHMLAQSGSYQLTTESLGSLLGGVMMFFVTLLAPLILVLMMIAFGISYIQVGPVFSVKAITPNLEKLDFVKGLKNLFSAKSLFNLIRDILKLAIIGLVGYFAIVSEFKHVIPLADSDAFGIMSFIGQSTFRVTTKICLAMVIVAVLDFFYQRYDYEKSLRMTRQELKEEWKLYEGAPEVKSRIRQTQRQIAMSRMMQNVPKADVVVTNPTEIAVALQYDAAAMSAPVVLAKGQRLMAERIKEIAREHDIPIVENKPLARALFKTVEVGMMIPANLYKAVAEVLAYVYRLKGKV